jgi:hypothetical protein
MPTFTLSLTITDTDGSTSVATATGNVDTITITQNKLTPDPAPPNTQRTWTVSAISSSGLVISFGTPTCSQSGITFTPVAGQPAGTAAWTFTI